MPLARRSLLNPPPPPLIWTPISIDTGNVAELQQTLTKDFGNVEGVPTPRSYLTPEQAIERAQRRAAFGATIKRLRLAAGLTQEQLALDAGIDRPFLVQIENGKRSLLVERIDDLAEALGVTNGALFIDSD